MTTQASTVRTDVGLWVIAGSAATLALAARDVDRWSWMVAVSGGIVGLAMPLRRAEVRGIASWSVVTAAGIGLFVLTGTFWSVGITGGRGALAIGVVAGVAEEALFRRGLYGLVEHWGSRAAVLGTAVLFGLVHVPMYGWRALPIDIGAGLVFGWQRWSTGSWTAPAITHALANTVQYL